MSLNDKTIGVYYHMPFIVKDNHVKCNPVIATFIESLIPYFKKIYVFGFECVINSDRITYRIVENEKITFVSLGPEGRFWDHFQNHTRMKKALKDFKLEIDILILRLPSYKAFAVWKYLGKPRSTVLLFVGNPLNTSVRITKNFMNHYFRSIRSFLFNRRMKRICRKPSSVVLANSKSLMDVWGNILDRNIELVNTSSISKSDIIPDKTVRKFKSIPLKLLFVGRIRIDKGIGELFEALRILNQRNKGRYTLDLVGGLDYIGDSTLRELAEKHGVLNDINYLGVVPFGEQLFQQYRNADIYILPSYEEGMPHTIWEAMSQGAPVIATSIGGIGDFFTDGEDIIFIDVKNAQSIVKAVKKLENDSELQSKLIKNGLKKVSGITREAQAEKIVRLLKKLKL